MFRNTSLKRRVVPLLLLAAATPLFAIDFVNLKGYYESGQGSNKSFNYSGQQIVVTNLGPGRTLVNFQGLSDWTLFPTLQVSPRTNIGNGYDTCSGQFDQSPSAAVVVLVTCRRGGNLFSTGFSVMILDMSSDAGYAFVEQAGSCLNCGAHGFSHNPWKKTPAGSDPIQVSRLSTGRSRVVFNGNWSLNKGPYPIALVTPVMDNASCQIYSVGFGGETSNQYGAEVRCNNFQGTPMDTTFRLLLVPPSERTAYALVLANGSAGFGIVSNPKGSPEEFFGPGYIDIEKFGTGQYQVAFPRIGGTWADDGVVKVNSHGGSGVNCGVANFYRNGTYPTAIVACKAVSGALADSNFTILMTSRN